MAVAPAGPGDGARVRATVNYVRNPPSAGAPTLEFHSEAEERSTMQTLPGAPVWVHDVRGQPTSLDREGFVLVAHHSAVTDFGAIEEDEAVDEQYGEELVDLVSAVTGADRVLMLGGAKKRFAERAVDELAPLTNAMPARYPHADNTDESSVTQVDLFASFVDGLDVAEYRRHALLNLWRCVTPPPQDVPLAVCDARTLTPAHEVPVTSVTEIRGFGPYRHDTTGYLHDDGHRWCWFPDMTPDEVIVFKTHDTDPDRARRVAHSAFDAPDCPPGTPPRASVEARALALFR